MTEISGWLDPKVAAAMRELIARDRPSVMVEIGVYAGKSLINAALALKANGHGVIYGIDPWRTRDAVRGMAPEENISFWANTDLNDVHTACIHAIWEHEVEEQVVIIRATSRMAAPLFWPLSINVLYIDGAHSEERATWDAVNYLPRVKRGGAIWVDDTNYASLQKALSVLRECCTLEQDFGHAQLYRKA